MPTYSCPVPVSLPNRLRFQVSSFTSLQGMDIYKDKLCRGHIHIASPSAQRPGKPESYPVNSWLYRMQGAGKTDTWGKYGTNGSDQLNYREAYNLSSFH